MHVPHARAKVALDRLARQKLRFWNSLSGERITFPTWNSFEESQKNYLMKGQDSWPIELSGMTVVSILLQYKHEKNGRDKWVAVWGMRI